MSETAKKVINVVVPVALSLHLAYRISKEIIELKNKLHSKERELLALTKCVYCGMQVHSKFRHNPIVQQTICCVYCCNTQADYKHTPMDGLITGLIARQLYGCTDEDLDCLKCNIHSKALSVKFYISAEARYLGVRRRVLSLGSSLLASIDERMRYYFAEYVTESFDKSKNVDWEKVFERIRDVTSRCKGYHPEGVFFYCLRNKNASAEDFNRLRKSMRHALRLEGHRILSFVGADEVKKLRNGPLADLYRSFMNRDTKAILASHLSRFLPPADVEFALWMKKWCKPDSIRGREDAAADEILQKISRKKEQVETVRKELLRHHLTISDNHTVLQKFLQEELDLSLEALICYLKLEQEIEKRKAAGAKTFWYSANLVVLPKFVSFIESGFDLCEAANKVRSHFGF